MTGNIRAMRRERATLIIAALVVAMLAALAGPAHAASTATTHIVQLRDGVSLASGQAAVRAADGHVTGRLPIINGLAVRASDRAAARLARDARVAAIDANARIRSQHQAIEASKLATAYPASVLAPQAWSTATGAGVGVAVIDTGIDGSLPDFAGADGTSRVIASAVTNHDATTADDTYGHGTHVAGIIAGDGTRRPAGDPVAGKYVGIAPDANLIAIKAADDDGRGTILDAIYGLQFAVDHQAEYNIRVVNLSLSSTEAQSYSLDPLDAAVESAYFHGILVVAAAGNRGAAGMRRTTRPATIRSRSRSAPWTTRGRPTAATTRSPTGPASARRRTASRSPTSRRRARTSSRRWRPTARSPGCARAASSTATTCASAARRWPRRSSRASPR